VALIKCSECSENISKKAKECPKCGHPNKNADHLSGGQVIGGLLLGGAALWFFAGGGLEQQAAKDLQNIENQVAEDSVQEYNIAKNQGDPMQVCVQAGLVSAAYLQANDQKNYNKWKGIEKADCKAAGISQ
jgi:hypothetical protein